MIDRHIVLFLIDGLRPDGLRRAATPVIDGLAAAGTAAMDVRTVMPSVSLPCITSMFTGLPPEDHGVMTNLWTPRQPAPLGIADLVHMAGGTAIACYNWEELRDLSRPGALEAALFLRNCDDPSGAGDRVLARLTAAWLSVHRVSLAFVYLGNVDAAGHAAGWMSDVYLDAVANADCCVGRVLQSVPDGATVFVTSDHGGHGQGHGTDSDEDMTVPVVVAGPGVDLGWMASGALSILDIAPSILTCLGIPVPEQMVGEPIAVSREMLGNGAGEHRSDS